jgi:hypothetical protein
MSSTVIKTSRARQCATKYTSRNFKLYADVSVLRDLVTDSGVDAGTWKIHVFGAGTLVVRPVNGPVDGSLDTSLTVPANTKLDLELAALVSGTATAILVEW